MTWINASELYNWANGDHLLDWLNMFGVEKGHSPDEPDPHKIEEAELSLFTRKKGQIFESRVLELIRKSADAAVIEGARGNHDSVYEQTLRLMGAGQEVIYQGLVRESDQKVFGVPDILILGSVLERVVPGSLVGPPDTYYVVDVKYKGLDLNKQGDLAAKHRWEKVQLAVYESALATMLNRSRQRSYLLGRSADGDDGGCFDKLGWQKPEDPKTLDKVRTGLEWIRELRASGSSWALVPPSDPRLAPNTASDDYGRWNSVIAKLIPEKDYSNDPHVSPAQIASNRADWFDRKGVEFYVDFETLNSLNDHFTSLPSSGGTPMIFMIGCGHEEQGTFVFTVWTARDETHEEEARIIDEWFAHMKQTTLRLAPHVDIPTVFHWHNHEQIELGKAAGRHTRPDWKEVGWYDLLVKVMRAEPVTVRGAKGHGLKAVARSMNELRLIDTVWSDGPVSGGTEAMTAAWWCYEQSRQRGLPVHNVAPDGRAPLMPEIERYNEVDCRVMWEILQYFRANH
jgi:hypothetical protein